MLQRTHDMPQGALTTILHTAINYLLLYQQTALNKSLSHKNMSLISQKRCAKILCKKFSAAPLRKRILLFLVELCNVCYMYWRKAYV